MHAFLLSSQSSHRRVNLWLQGGRVWDPTKARAKDRRDFSIRFALRRNILQRLDQEGKLSSDKSILGFQSRVLSVDTWVEEAKTTVADSSGIQKTGHSLSIWSHWWHCQQGCFPLKINVLLEQLPYQVYMWEKQSDNSWKVESKSLRPSRYVWTEPWDISRLLKMTIFE